MTPPVPPDRRRVTTARTRAQAKINLFLRVLAREDSGYHQIETLFCRLDLGDDVVVRVGARGRSLEVTGGAVPPGGLGPIERNLAWRAAEAFSARVGWPNDWSIELGKHVPVGGGLGGGSADAGAVLRCLQALAPAPVDTLVLIDIAARLGADVPFLTIDAPLAIAWGRGDRLIPLAALPARDVALACFPFPVPTPDAYRWLDEVSDGSAGATILTLEQIASWSHVGALAHNDFEPAVAARFPQIAATLSTWRTAASSTAEGATTMLSGSGATVFHVAERIAPEIENGLDPAVRVIRTRTATRVVGVEVAD